MHLRERGIRHDLIAAAFAMGEEDDLVRLSARAEALQRFIDSDDGRNLLTAFRRASNIVAIEEKKDGRRYDGVPAAGALVEPTELGLLAALEDAREDIDGSLAEEDYGAAMAALASCAGRSTSSSRRDGQRRGTRPATEPSVAFGPDRLSLARVADFSLIEAGSRPD